MRCRENVGSRQHNKSWKVFSSVTHPGFFSNRFVLEEVNITFMSVEELSSTRTGS